MKRSVVVLSLALALWLNTCPNSVQASVVGLPLGPAAPPGTLGPYTMTPFPLDSRPLDSWVTSVDSPLGGTVDFGSTVLLRQAETSWSGWGHGYTGSVYYTGGYYTGGKIASLTLTLPLQTTAFYVYAQPVHYDTWQITATAQDGTSVVQYVYDAAGYGFYGTGGSLISWIQLSTPHMDGFGLGEFGIAAVPVPGALLLGGIGIGLVGHFRRRRTR